MDGQEARYSLYSEDAMRRSMRRSTNRSQGNNTKKNKTAEALGVVPVGEDEDYGSFANSNNNKGAGAATTTRGNNNAEEDLPFFQMLREEIAHPKWRMLFFICMLYFGKQFIYDFPSSFGTGEGSTIEARFRDHGKEYNQKMNQALYSVYAYPNMILALVGGVLIDKILGIRRSVILFSVLITLGGFIFWIGVQTVQYPVMILGRFVVGLGGESIAVAKTAFIARWFYGGRGLSFAYGVTITGIRLGSGLNFLISPSIADDHGVNIACLVGVSLCVFSTMCTVMLVWMDTRYDRLGYLPEPAKQVAAAALTSTADADNDADNNDGASTTVTTPAPISVCEHLKRMPSQIYNLSIQYWLLCAICVCLYGSDLPFIGFAKNFFQVKWDLSPTEAGLAMSVYQLVSAVSSPITGALIDKIGRHAFVLFISGALFASTHVILIWTSAVPPIVIMVMQGLFFSLMIPSLWPSVPIVVDPSLVAVGFGLMMSIQNIGIATIPLIVGSILDAHTPSDDAVNPSSNSTTTAAPLGNLTTTTTSAPVLRKAAVDSTVEGYIAVEYVMLGIGAVGVALALVLIIYDLKKERLLTGSPSSRNKRLDDIDDERERLLQGSDIEDVNTTTTTM